MGRREREQDLNARAPKGGLGMPNDTTGTEAGGEARTRAREKPKTRAREGGRPKRGKGAEEKAVLKKNRGLTERRGKRDTGGTTLP